MNRVLVLLCALFLIATAVSGQESRVKPNDPLTWLKYTVKGEDFSVSLPTTPEMKTSSELRPQTQKERTGRHLKTMFNGVTYAVDVFENSDQQSLDNLIADYNATKDFDPGSERSITVNGVSGKEYTSSNSPSARVQFFATTRRFYRFIAIGDEVSKAAVKQFFSSIALGDKVNGIQVKVGPGAPLETATGERIYRGSEVDRKIHLIKSPPPEYPEEARKAGTRGVVVLQAVFSKTGKVVDIYVVSPVPVKGVTEACIEAAEKIQFTPAVLDGRNVNMYMTLEYNIIPI